MNTLYASLRQQFIAKHGGDCIHINGWLVFSDGATMDRNPAGALAEPPTDPYERWKIVARYREELLRRATDQFTEANRELRSRAHVAMRDGLPPPNREEIDKLKELQQTVKRCQQRYAAAREQMKRTTPEWMRGRDETAAHNRESNSRVLDELKRIQI